MIKKDLMMKVNCKVYLFVFFLVISFSISSFAASDSTFTKTEADTNIISGRPAPFDWLTNLPSDWWHWSKQSFATKQLPLIGGLTALTAITIITDYESWQAFKKPYDNNKIFRQVSDVTSYLGDGKVQFGLAGAYLLYGFVFNDDRAVRTASQITEVILASGGVVQLLKHLSGRESPFVATTPTGRWKFFPNQIQYAKHVPNHDAFPSGHIATVLATITVIAENYPNEKWIKYIGYPIVASVGVGLVATSIHWWSDIPLGVAIGYSFGMLVSHPEGESNTSQSLNGVQSSMNFSVLGNGAPALGLSLKW